jgi:hypothetical protein
VGRAKHILGGQSVIKQILIGQSVMKQILIGQKTRRINWRAES